MNTYQIKYFEYSVIHSVMSRNKVSILTRNAVCLQRILYDYKSNKTSDVITIYNPIHLLKYQIINS